MWRESFPNGVKHPNRQRIPNPIELVESALMDSGITLSSDLHIGFVACLGLVKQVSEDEFEYESDLKWMDTKFCL